MGKRRVPGGETREVHPLVQSIVGKIVARMKTREGTAKLATRHVQTLYGWLNGRRRNPSLLAVNDYAEAVGLTLSVSDGTSLEGDCRRPHVVSDFEKTIIAMIRSLPGARDREELERVVRDFVLTHTSGSRPLLPTGATPGEPE